MILDDRPAGPRLGAHSSLAIEIDWALSSAHWIGRHPIRPAAEELFRRQPGLREEVLALWGPDEALSYAGYLELSIIAHHGGMLFGPHDRGLIESLEELCADAPADLVLGAEKPEDRKRLLQRLEVLRTSTKRRKHYVDVVSRVWAALLPAWEQDGAPAVEAQVRALEAQLARRPAWQEFVTSTHCKSAEDVEGLVSPLGAEGELAVVPAWFGHSGLIVDLPGLVVMGVEMLEADPTGRARSEQLARRLKAVADPTRLAILSALGRADMTVSEVARRFSLSQPTVSNHVKMLREAGLVTQRTDGRNRYLIVQRDAVKELGSELIDAVAGS
jgi:ArsR family transcriptional regulator, arsenate/arsenite/antimonite-responsive transcriptional repressor